MAPLQSLASATLLFLSVANAHFNLNAPPSFGFDENKEDSAPCGGFTPNFDDKSKVSDFHVGGEPIGVKLGHTQANWLYRATLGGSDSKNWTQLFPIVQQSGLGFFCEPSVTAPEAWVGKQGILSVVADAPDGLLYQVSQEESSPPCFRVALETGANLVSRSAHPSTSSPGKASRDQTARTAA
jgi:hypothetical protein